MLMLATSTANIKKTNRFLACLPASVAFPGFDFLGLAGLPLKGIGWICP